MKQVGEIRTGRKEGGRITTRPGHITGTATQGRAESAPSSRTPEETNAGTPTTTMHDTKEARVVPEILSAGNASTKEATNPDTCTAGRTMTGRTDESAIPNPQDDHDP